MTLWQRFRQRYSSAYENPERAERRVELLVLFAVLLVLVVALAALGRTLVGFLPVPVPPAADSLNVKSLALQLPLSAEESKTLLSRPAFWAARRPIVVEAVAAAPKAAPVKVQPLEGVVLLGVFGSDESMGLIAKVDNSVSRLHVGDSLKGWRLEAYEAGTARFVRGGAVSTVTLKVTEPLPRPKAQIAMQEDDAATAENANNGNGSQKSDAARAKSTEKPVAKKKRRGLTFGGRK